MKPAFYGLQQENSYFFHVPAIEKFHFSKGERKAEAIHRLSCVPAVSWCHRGAEQAMVLSHPAPAGAAASIRGSRLT